LFFDRGIKKTGFHEVGRFRNWLPENLAPPKPEGCATTPGSQINAAKNIILIFF